MPGLLLMRSPATAGHVSLCCVRCLPQPFAVAGAAPLNIHVLQCVLQSHIKTSSMLAIVPSMYKSCSHAIGAQTRSQTATVNCHVALTKTAPATNTARHTCMHRDPPHASAHHSTAPPSVKQGLVHVEALSNTAPNCAATRQQHTVCLHEPTTMLSCSRTQAHTAWPIQAAATESDGWLLHDNPLPLAAANPPTVMGIPGCVCAPV